MTHRPARFAALLVLIILIFTAMPLTASADTGPKPSVNIDFKNVPEGRCYGTLLSKNPSTGPHSVYDPEHDYNFAEQADNAEYRAIWQAFVDYKDGDGYYFLQLFWEITPDNGIAWGYYPPDDFKILLYYNCSGF